MTLKGFIYAAIAGTSAFIEVRTLIAGSLGSAKWIVMLAFLPPMLLFGVLASPLGREQPTEVWLLSRIRFFFKPRTRIWDQSGANNLVTITAPKRQEVQLTKNLSQTEVKSRLQALASTLDSRGWAVKSAAVDSAAVPAYLSVGSNGSSDRLIAPSSVPQDEPVMDLHDADDIMDEQNNPTAQKFASMMRQADDKRKKEIVDKINAARSAGNTTFLDSQQVPGARSTTFVGSNVVAPSTQIDDQPAKSDLTDAERQLLERMHREAAELESKLPKHFAAKSSRSVDKTPVTKTAASQAPPKPAQQVTPEAQADKLELAQSGNDLSVASIAHLANRKNMVQQIGPNEFEIDLH